MSTRMERLADLPIRAATDFIAQDGDDDTVIVEGEVLDYLLDERDRLRELLAGCLGYYDRTKDRVERIGGSLRVEAFEKARDTLVDS